MTVNVIMCSVIVYVVKFEKRSTSNDETMVMYARIRLLTFVNIGLIILFVNIDLFQDESKLFLGFLPIFNGDYQDLNADWYATVGVTVSFSLVLGVFTPHASYFAFTFMYMVLRWWDGGCRSIE